MNPDTNQSTKRTLIPLRTEYVVFVLILLISFLLRMAFLHEPFERDEGFYGYIGQEILRGSIPYRDIYDIKPPGIYYIYAAIIALFGNIMEAIRMATAFYALATTGCVYLLARKLGGIRAAICSALLFALCSNAPHIQGSSSNTEVFMLLPLMLCLLFFVRGVETGNRVNFVISGFSGGIALLIKTVALPVVALVFIFLLRRPRADDSGEGLQKDILSFILPPLATLLLLYGYFAANNALADLYYWNFTILKSYGRHGLSYFVGKAFAGVDYLINEQLLLWGAAVAGAAWLLLRNRNFHTVLVTLTLPAAVAGLCMPGHFFPHYFILLTPFCAVVGGLGLGHVWERKGWPRFVSLPLIAAGVVLFAQTNYKYYFAYTPAEVALHKYNVPTFGQSPEIAGFVRNNTAPGDYILQWGFEPELYFYSNRRGLKDLTVFVDIEWAPDRTRAIKNMVENINEKKPVYILVQKADVVDYRAALGYRELAEIIARDYTFTKEIGYAEIYRRKPDHDSSRTANSGGTVSS